MVKIKANVIEYYQQRRLVIPAESRVADPGKVPAGILPVGSWKVEGLHKPAGGKCVLLSEEEVMLNNNTHLALVNPMEVKAVHADEKRTLGECVTRKMSRRKPLPEELQRFC